jgi:hypothetical protein
MEEAETRALCLALMQADYEQEVVRLLRTAGYWADAAAWRYYGDRESNFNTIGNQQSRPEAALVEKVINSVDARLMNECLLRGIEPEGDNAPQSIKEAVAEFFEENPQSTTAGLIREWPSSKRTEVSRGITLAATGAMPRDGNPCFTISDNGEGQTPESMPRTLLSLDRENKLRIPFVQGKFNMGGTGALRFCGHRNLQLVVSRRNPATIGSEAADPSHSDWGFTVVRREDPQGGRRSSVYTYLAPLGCDARPKRGGVLRFASPSVPIFPDGRDPYARECAWGTLVKLYEYSATGFRTHILRRKGLLSRLDLLIPDVALPIRLHECRGAYRGHEGSFETTLTGIVVRLDDDRARNLEDGFPSSCPMDVAGQKLTVMIYAFRKGKADTYRANEGIVFTVNGQTHGHLTTDFFTRSRLRLGYLRHSLLVVVDCSALTGRAREDLFINSRDRLSGSELRVEIERALEEVLRHHAGLQALSERRRREEIEGKLKDSKPLEEVLRSLLARSPTLAAIFLRGGRISTPFKTRSAQAQDKTFQGKRYPTYFKFMGKDYGTILDRECHSNMRCRVTFETDVANDYFSRSVDPGDFTLSTLWRDGAHAARDYSLNLQNGIGTLSLQLPVGCRVNDRLRYVATVADSTQLEPFRNEFTILVKKAANHPPGPGGRTRMPPSDRDGTQRERPAAVQMPNVIHVHESPTDEEKSWDSMEPPFDKYSAMRVVQSPDLPAGIDDQAAKYAYDFFVNVDNLYLKNEMKGSSTDADLLVARFVFGMVLLGMSLLHDDAQQTAADANDDSLALPASGPTTSVADGIEHFSRAVAPTLLPMIDYLGALDLEATQASDDSGEVS